MNDWRDDAACFGKPTEMFFPDNDDRSAIAAAKAICASCPVIADCGTAGGRSEYGIWGGSTETERQVKLPRLPRSVRPMTHGTSSGYVIHRNRGEEACQDCLEARAAYMRTRAAARKASA